MQLTVSDAQALYDFMLGFVGIPYRYGGNGPAGGIDCSGLVLCYLEAAGLWPNGQDASAQAIHDWCAGRNGPIGAATSFGDLAFFGAGEHQVEHVALCLTQKLMLEAGGGDASTRTTVDAIARNAFVRVRPIKFRRDLVTVLRP